MGLFNTVYNANKRICTPLDALENMAPVDTGVLKCELI